MLLRCQGHPDGIGHPRLTGRDLAADPLVPGHEVSITVVAVGAGLTGRYRVGQRFAVQPDIWCDGRSLPYGYSLDGAFQQYGLIGREILAGDVGSYPGRSRSRCRTRPPRDRAVGVRRGPSYRANVPDTHSKPGGPGLSSVPGSRPGYRLDAIWRDHATGPGRPHGRAGRLAEAIARVTSCRGLD